MARDVSEAANALMRADDNGLLTLARHDPDMIRDVAAALLARLSPKPERRHNEDCELRGDGPCYCDQSEGAAP